MITVYHIFILIHLNAIYQIIATWCVLKLQDVSVSSSPEVTFTSCVQVEHKAYQQSDDIASRLQKQIADVDIRNNKKLENKTVKSDENMELRKYTEFKVRNHWMHI